MTDQRKREILDTAKKVNDLSEKFQLIHATYASERLIRQVMKEHFEKELSGLSQKIKNCSSGMLDELSEEKRSLEDAMKRRICAISVDFVDISTDRARTVKINNSFTIYLPRELQDHIKDEHGKRDYEVMRKIRKMMAHELGHLALHTDALMEENNTVGTLAFQDGEREAEADLFGEDLLERRRIRNQEIFEDGGAHNLL